MSNNRAVAAVPPRQLNPQGLPTPSSPKMRATNSSPSSLGATATTADNDDLFKTSNSDCVMSGAAFADFNNPRGDRHVYQMTPTDLCACTKTVCSAVLQAVTTTLADGYLNTKDIAASAGLRRPEPPGDEGGGMGPEGPSNDNFDIGSSTHSVSASGSLRGSSKKRGSKMDGKNNSGNNKQGAIDKFPVPATEGDLFPLIRPPRSINRYRTSSEMLRTFIPFGMIVPLVVVSTILVVYNYAGVKICGMTDDCQCTAGERALFFATFGLFQDVPAALIFSCLVVSTIMNIRLCNETTAKRREHNAPSRNQHNKKNHHGGGGSSLSNNNQHQPTGFTSIENAERGGQTDQERTIALSYGPYVLKNLGHYLHTKEVILTAFFTALFPIIVRAVSLLINMPDFLILPLVFVVKCIPLFVLGALKRNMMAAMPCVVLILVPLSFQIFSQNITKDESVRRYVTAFWPLIIVVMDRIYLVLIKLSAHPSTSVGTLTIYTTLLSFTTQTLQLGLGVTIDGPANPIVISVYVVQFVLFEMFFNTVLMSRLGCYIVYRFSLFRYRRSEAAITSDSHNKRGATSASTAQKPPLMWRYQLRLTDIGNIAALTRLPTLLVSFIFMIPALHFPKWPQKTAAIDCEGNTHYQATWVNYGFVTPVCLLIGIATLLMRRLEKRNMILQCVFGSGWSVLVGMYLFSIVVLSLGFLPTSLFFAALPSDGPQPPPSP